MCCRGQSERKQCEQLKETLVPFLPSHEACQLTTAWTKEVHHGEDRCDHVDQLQHQGHNQHVQIELSWYSSAFIPIIMNITEHANIILLQVNQVIKSDVSDIPSVPIYQLSETNQSHPYENHQSGNELQYSFQEVGFKHSEIIF